MYYQHRPINITIYGTEVGNGFITWDGFFIPYTSTCSSKYSPKFNYYENPYKCCIYELKRDRTIRDSICHYKNEICPNPPENLEWDYVTVSDPVMNCQECNRYKNPRWI
ncbi:hypothetical protein [Bacillus pseudomycoides]|uniref:hypothetical protein n=1 Tax=Bacillus pseudomycoides TaxID=64104 RepID=UPI000BF5C413|nr:hypothetical protein [Bacillus pseudomycoides]PEP56246.1 hypothetical protein CN564_18085 [Bacillus pseudomycoides]